MLSWLAKLLLTATAIAPVGVSYAWVAYTDNRLDVALLTVAASLGLALICILMLRYARKNLESSNFQISTVEAADRENTTSFDKFCAQFEKIFWFKKLVLLKFKI